MPNYADTRRTSGRPERAEFKKVPRPRLPARRTDEGSSGSGAEESDSEGSEEGEGNVLIPKSAKLVGEAGPAKYYKWGDDIFVPQNGEFCKVAESEVENMKAVGVIEC